MRIILALHKDKRIKNFREKVYYLSSRKATPQEISREIYDANHELHKLEIDSLSLVIGFFYSDRWFDIDAI